MAVKMLGDCLRHSLDAGRWPLDELLGLRHEHHPGSTRVS